MLRNSLFFRRVDGLVVSANLDLAKISLDLPVMRIMHYVTISILKKKGFSLSLNLRYIF